MASHFLSNDYLPRSKHTLNKSQISTLATADVPVWRAGKANEKARAIEEARKQRSAGACLKGVLVTLEKMEKNNTRKRNAQKYGRYHRAKAA